MRFASRGARWTGKKATRGSLEGLHFVDTAHGWAAGDTMLRTSNGGASWQKIALDSGATVGDVAFASTTRGWAVQQDQIIGSSDGGKTWRSEWQNGPARVLAVTTISSQSACAVGYLSSPYTAFIMRTDDGGATWVQQAAPVATWLRDVEFVGATRGWAVGSLGVILATADRGQTWVGQPSGTGLELRGIDMVNASLGYVAGERGIVLKTSDGGAHWRRVR